MTSVLVYGFYGHGNTGDQLFEDAFKIIFPKLSFTFTNHITTDQITMADAVFFGGGSFLYVPPNIDADAVVLLHKKPILYIGVGIETTICYEHRDLLKKALLIAPRTIKNNLSLLQSLSNNIFPIIDLVYSLSPEDKQIQKPNSVLILPNISTVPIYSAPYWKHISWQHFKFEFAQFIDELIDMNYKPQFFAMQQYHIEHDNWVAQEIINQMSHRSTDLIIAEPKINFTEFQYVITQRFHGTILSEINEIPYMCIYHSDKLKDEDYNIGEFVSFFNCSKQSLFDHFFEIHSKIVIKAPMKEHIFEALKSKVYALLEQKCQSTPELKTII